MKKKKHNPQQAQSRADANQSREYSPLFDKKEIPQELNTKQSNRGTNDPQKNEEQRMFRRFIMWVREDAKFTDFCIAAFTLSLVLVSTYQGCMLRSQVDSMRKTVRPFLYAVPFFSNEWKALTEHDIQITVRVINTANYPATNETHSIPTILLGTPQTVMQGIKKCDVEYTSAPDSVAPHDSFLVVTVRSQKIDDEERKRIADSIDIIAVYGGVKYSGFGNEDFETKYCFIYNPTGSPWSPCSCKTLK